GCSLALPAGGTAPVPNQAGNTRAKNKLSFVRYRNALPSRPDSALPSQLEWFRDNKFIHPRSRAVALRIPAAALSLGGLPTMRCLNSHTALMETDAVCPSCHSAATPVATKALLERRRKGLLQVQTEAFGSKLARVPGLKWVVGLPLFLVAGAVILL